MMIMMMIIMMMMLNLEQWKRKYPCPKFEVSHFHLPGCKKKTHFLYITSAFIHCKKMEMTTNLYWRIPRLRASAIINYPITGGNWTVFWTPSTNFHLLSIWNQWMTQNFHVFSQCDTKKCYTTTLINQP